MEPIKVFIVEDESIVREGIRVYQFLKNPLTKVFGEDFYEALCAAATHLDAE